ncbi:TPA: hypothetical protein ACSP7Y_002185 [Serratia fonticola]
MNNNDLDKINARLSTLEVALGYTITNITSVFPESKPAIIAALRRDFELNKDKNQVAAKSLHDLANLIEAFKIAK